MAEALVEERHLLKSLRWWDGFVIALCNPGFLIASLGFSMGALGTWGAVTLWAISAAVGMLQAWIYAETASMFPDKPGGIALYAHEGWRGRFSLVGPIGAYGYWIGWSVVLSIFGVLIGTLIQAQWFPQQHLVGVRRRGAPGPGPVHRARLHRRGLGAERLRDPPGRVVLLCRRGRADGAAGDLHRGAVLHRGLAQLQHDLGDTERLGRLQAGHGLPVPVRLVVVRGRGVRDVRPGIPRHPAGYHDGAPFGRRVHAAGVPAVPAGHRRGLRRAEHRHGRRRVLRPGAWPRSWAAARPGSSSCCSSAACSCR